MNRRYTILVFGILLILSSHPLVKGQTASNLIPNDPSTNQDMAANGEALYSSDLTSGTWTVIASCDSFWDMQFRIQVSLSSNMSDVIASGQGAGDQGVTVEFTLDDSNLVYIQVEEIGGNTGFFSIGVYDEAHVGDNPLDTSPINTEGSLFPMTTFLLVPLVFIIGIVVVGAIIFRMRSGGPTIEDVFRMQAPDQALPERYRSEPQTSDIRTVRLPVSCTSCGASLTKDSIDWTGPLEAECQYCGAVVRAKLEKL